MRLNAYVLIKANDVYKLGIESAAKSDRRNKGTHSLIQANYTSIVATTLDPGKGLGRKP